MTDAVFLGFTSFEEPFKHAASFSTIPNFIDSGDTAVAHMLQNDPLFPLVEFSSAVAEALGTSGVELTFESWFDPTTVLPHAPAGGSDAGFASPGGPFGVIGDESSTAMQGSGAGDAPPGPLQSPWTVQPRTRGLAFFMMTDVGALTYVALETVRLTSTCSLATHFPIQI